MFSGHIHAVHISTPVPACLLWDPRHSVLLFHSICALSTMSVSFPLQMVCAMSTADYLGIVHLPTNPTQPHLQATYGFNVPPGSQPGLYLLLHPTKAVSGGCGP